MKAVFGRAPCAGTCGVVRRAGAGRGAAYDEVGVLDDLAAPGGDVAGGVGRGEGVDVVAGEDGDAALADAALAMHDGTDVYRSLLSESGHGGGPAASDGAVSAHLDRAAMFDTVDITGTLPFDGLENFGLQHDQPIGHIDDISVGDVIGTAARSVARTSMVSLRVRVSDITDMSPGPRRTCTRYRCSRTRPRVRCNSSVPRLRLPPGSCTT